MTIKIENGKIEINGIEPFTPQTRTELAAARKRLKAVGVNRLLSIDSDPKTAKSNRANKGYYTAILYLAPASMSGFNLCVSATIQCIFACLMSSGNPIYLIAKTKARIAKSRAFIQNRDDFAIVLFAEINAFCAVCRENGLRPAIRLNGTSDVIWEKIFPWLFSSFKDCQFYDYSKILKRFRPEWQLPSNYSLTLSRSEVNEADCLEILRINPNARVAVVFDVKRGHKLPLYWEGYRVLDADLDDLRFLDGCSIAGLRAKGKARNYSTGSNSFVVDPNPAIYRWPIVTIDASGNYSYA